MNTDLPDPNIPLLRKAVEWAEAEAAKTDGTCAWNQNVYRDETECGAAYCIAGWTVFEAAGLDRVSSSEIEDRAQEMLGITPDEGWELFDPDNSITDVRRLAEQIAARAGERL